MRILDLDQAATPESAVEAHIALPESRPTDRAFLRLNMISSVDGGTAVAGVSGALGNRDDHAVFAALRAQADVCLVGLGTVVAEHYRVPDPPQLQLYVVSDTNDLTGAEELFASGRATLVLPQGLSINPDAADGLLDEFFVTIAPRVIAGSSARVAHGPDADASLWELAHGFLDDDGFLFLRYCRC